MSTFPLNPFKMSCLQPRLVCNAVRTFESVLMYSMISISPSLGQLGPTVQNAGQTEQPLGAAIPAVLGKCSTSKIIKLLGLMTALDFSRIDFLPLPLDFKCSLKSN